MKEKVLEILEFNRGKSISGSEIGKTLGLSRAAVWKNIKSLQEEGYQIDAATNRGYCLASDSDILSAAGIRQYLTTKTLGREIEIYQSTDSTNIRAKLAAQAQAPAGLVIAAEFQTAGKGRFGRNFSSPKQNGAYFSVLLRPDMDMEHSALITAAVSVCVAEAIEALTDSKVSIKWVNDLFVNSKKVCGILTEAAIEFESRKMEYAVVGIGINITSEGIPKELREIAGGIADGQEKPLRNRLIAEVLNRLERMLTDFSYRKFIEAYRRRSNVIGKRVLVIQGEHTAYGTALDIDEQAQLVVKMEEGGIRHLNSGEISCKII